MRPARHELDIYDTTVYIAATRKERDKALSQAGMDPEPAPTSSGLTSFRLGVPKVGQSHPYVIVFVDRRDVGDDHGVLVNTVSHEADHAASFLLDHLGEDYQGHSEAHAYLVGWFAQRIWEHVRASDRPGK